MSAYRDKILEKADKYYQELGTDFSHDINHFFRVERLAKRMGEDEKADLEILEAATLLFDIARGMEDRKEVEDHAATASQISKQILTEIGFPPEKIDQVCHAILVHRKSKGLAPETIEAKILQDADYLDAMGAIDVARVIGSSLQSEKYRRPIYTEQPFGENDENISAIHYLMFKIIHPKLQPENFHTRLGRELAKERFEFMKNYAEQFVAEWKGEK